MDAISATGWNVSRQRTDFGATFTGFATLMGFKRVLAPAVGSDREPRESLRYRHE